MLVLMQVAMLDTRRQHGSVCMYMLVVLVMLVLVIVLHG
jgi:hypothetical protein